MDYILIAAIAWMMFGGASVLEKYLLRAKLKEPLVLGFYTGAFAIFSVLIFLPYARFTSWPHLLFDLSCGIILLIAQLLLYEALALGDVSEVVPITGALIPIFSLLIVRFGLHYIFFANELIAIALLVLGTVLISYRKKAAKKVLLYALLCALFFAVYYSSVKLAYTPFKTNFAFVRLGSVLAALMLLVHKGLRKGIFIAAEQPPRKSGSLIFVSKEIIAGIGFIVLNYAISIGNPAIVNSLEGLEYAAIFILALFLSKHDPKILKEECDPKIIHRRFLAILLIIVGLIFLQL